MCAADGQAEQMLLGPVCQHKHSRGWCWAPPAAQPWPADFPYLQLPGRQPRIAAPPQPAWPSRQQRHATAACQTLCSRPAALTIPHLLLFLLLALLAWLLLLLLGSYCD